ncbi:MAG: pilus assembly protein PilM [Planctomycetota bacterium]
MALSFKKLSALGSAKLMGGSLSPIAFDFGTSQFKILQITTGAAPHLVAAAAIEMPSRLRRDPEARLAFQIEALPKMVRAGGFKGKRAVCSMPASMSFCKHLKVSKTDGISTEGLIKAKLQASLNCDPSGLVYRWVPVESGTGRGRDEVISMGAARDVIQRLMRAVKAAKLEPVAMHSDFQAILSAMQACAQQIDDHEDKPTLYLELGSGGTRVLVGDGDKLVFAKQVEIGGRHLDEYVARQLNIDLETARSTRLGLESLVPAAAAAEPEAAEETQPAATAGKSGLAMLEAAMKRSKPSTADENGSSAIMSALDETAVGMESLDEAMERTGADLTEPLEILTDEVQMCVRYYNALRPGRKVERVVFLGGESRQMALCTHVARRLKLPAKIADPLASVTRTGHEPCIGTDLRGSQPGWAVPLGLCVRPTDL